MGISKSLRFFLMMVLALPSMGWAQENLSDPGIVAVDGFPHGVTLQEIGEAHVIEDGLDRIRQNIMNDRQDLTVAKTAGDKLKINAAKKQLALDWRNYRVQRVKLNKLTGVDYQNFDFSQHQPPVQGPPPIITLQELREKRILEDRIKFIRQSIVNNRLILDAATNAGDDIKIKAAQVQLTPGFS